ncbi:MAG: hypothetical protein IJY70_06220 [Clostridia bacterium]|nr:hypothetical protein [Clostridia bacterium]
MTKEKLSKLLTTIVAIASLIYGVILIFSIVMYYVNVKTPFTNEFFLYEELINCGDNIPTIIGFTTHLITHSLFAFILVIVSAVSLKKCSQKPIIVCFIILTILEIVSEFTLSLSPISLSFSLSGVRPKFLYVILAGVGIALSVTAMKLPQFIYSEQPEKANNTETNPAPTVSKSEEPTATSETATTATEPVPTVIATPSQSEEPTATSATATTATEPVPTVIATPSSQNAPNSEKKIVNEKKKAITRQIIIYAIAGVLAFVTGLFFGTVGLIFGIAAVGICAYFCFYNIIAINRSFCSKCGAKYDYEGEISWTVTQEENTGDAIYDYVDITCHCSDCGEVKQFQQKFKVAYYNKQKNTVVRNDIRTLVRNYFKKI